MTEPAVTDPFLALGNEPQSKYIRSLLAEKGLGPSEVRRIQSWPVSWILPVSCPSRPRLASCHGDFGRSRFLTSISVWRCHVWTP